MRSLQKSIAEAVVRRRLLVTQNSRKQTRDSIDQHDRGDRAVGQDIIADRDFRVHQLFDHAVINSFVMPANDDQVLTRSKAPSPFAD